LETKGNKERKISLDKFVALDDEVRASINLILSGLHELQCINGSNDFYHLPFLILSNGFEKLLKLIICFYHWEQYGEFPKMKDFVDTKNNGHNLLFLKDKVLVECFKSNTPALKKDLDILSNNNTLNQIISFLGEFGQYSRFYNLDIIISNPSRKSKDIKNLWEKLETELLTKDKSLFEKFKSYLNNINEQNLKRIEAINDNVQTKIIILLEIFVRALTRQFIHGKLGQAQRFSSVISTFLHLDDNDLGKRDYKILLSKK